MLQSLISNKIFLKKILITKFLPVDYLLIVRNSKYLIFLLNPYFIKWERENIMEIVIFQKLNSEYWNRIVTFLCFNLIQITKILSTLNWRSSASEKNKQFVNTISFTVGGKAWTWSANNKYFPRWYWNIFLYLELSSLSTCRSEFDDNLCWSQDIHACFFWKLNELKNWDIFQIPSNDWQTGRSLVFVVLYHV